MKIINLTAAVGLAVVLAGCTTSSKVQEMIDASHQDYSARLDGHQDSINVLKQSAMTGLEKSKTNAEALDQLRMEIEEIEAKLQVLKDSAEASKIMSAANTVKLSDLESAVADNHRQVDETVARLAEIDKLFENVMLRHYEMIVQSANEAMSSLKAESRQAEAGTPVKLDEPIEILAPDTSVPVSTNPASTANP